MDELDVAEQILTMASEDFGIVVSNQYTYENVVDTLSRIPPQSRTHAVLCEVLWAYEKINPCPA